MIDILFFSVTFDMVQAEEKYAFPRDLVGYGQEGIDCEWPNGAKIAVSFCVNYE